ncbi:PREDICTED: cell growth-regulating nucleolar protein-like [Priapulus caudatus]|uniref:Cell growth-regulating nucleolar protein-like n=1 Tax=Priapulus caudatus TaxID=37621 RepID=A0ABM1E9Z1_PRICU|nr:PREDICTED: cell growth-regulating nucleolar protein-like [Priapulus caudatus]XP_014669013.1 PREDICTED: cell growth-regulating nucleolar protein-like [Priapulus caudatus]
MVFFTCNNCNETLKKKDVDKHCMTKCRNCQVVSCVDCSKEFWGDEYKQHIKCISEEEKYSGKDFKPKVKKGEAKQEQWMQNVQEAAINAKNPRVAELMGKIVEFTNIPRKKAKFENFIKNSVRVYDATLIDQAWEIFSAKPKEEEQQKKEPAASQVDSCESTADSASGTEAAKKKEKKKKSTKENAETVITNGNTGITESQSSSAKKVKTKKSGKEKNKATEETLASNGVTESNTKKKKRKLTNDEPVDSQSKKAKHDEEKDDKGQKFCWKRVIKKTLREAPDHKMKIKLLRSKVIATYVRKQKKHENMEAMTDEDLLKLFGREVLKNKKFSIHKKRVQLVA